MNAPVTLHDPAQFTDFKQWVNSLRDTELDPVRYHFAMTDIDAVFYRLQGESCQCFLLETKTHGETGLRASQRNLYPLLNAVLRFAHGRQLVFRENGTTRKVRFDYQGLHLLVLSDTTPDDSGYMMWDGCYTERDEIVRVLRFERSPVLTVEDPPPPTRGGRDVTSS